jgi:hypothetical protein
MKGKLILLFAAAIALAAGLAFGLGADDGKDRERLALEAECARISHPCSLGGWQALAGVGR